MFCSHTCYPENEVELSDKYKILNLGGNLILESEEKTRYPWQAQTCFLPSLARHCFCFLGFILCVGPRDGIQVVELGSKHLCPLSHLAGGVVVVIVVVWFCFFQTEFLCVAPTVLEFAL